MAEVLTTPKTAPEQVNSWDLWERMAPYRYAQESQWHINMAFLLGKHYAVWNPSARRLEDAVRAEQLGTTLNPKQTRVVSNHILRLFRQKLSDFVKMKPSVIVEAASEEASDLKSTEIAQNICLYLQHKHEFQALMRRFWTLQMVFGKASLYPCWNKQKGVSGEEELHLLTPFETYWPQGRWPDRPNEVFVVQTMDIDEIEERFGTPVAEESDIYASPVEQQIRNLLDQSSQLEDTKHMSRVLTHFKLPCKAYPNGLYRVEAPKKTVLYDGELRDMPWYFDDEGRGHLPVNKFDFYEMPMSRYGQSFIESLISPQREYNHKVSRITDHFRKFSGKWAVPFGAGMKEPLNDKTGQILYYDPQAGAPPTVLGVPGIPASLFQDLARCKMDMEDLAASHDVSNAKVPQGVKSGIAISALQEGDSSQMAPIVLAAEEGMGEVFKLMLAIVRHNYQEPRTLDIIGGDKKFQIPDFKGEQITGNHVLRVSLGSEHVFSKTVRQQHAIDLLGAGIIDVKEAREMIQVAEDNQIPEDVQQLAAKEAIKQMLNGVFVEVHDFDDHALFIKLINNVRAEPNFQATAPEDVKMIFELEFDLHSKSLMKEMAARMAGPPTQMAMMPQQPSTNSVPPPSGRPNG